MDLTLLIVCFSPYSNDSVITAKKRITVFLCTVTICKTHRQTLYKLVTDGELEDKVLRTENTILVCYWLMEFIVYLLYGFQFSIQVTASTR